LVISFSTPLILIALAGLVSFVLLIMAALGAARSRPSTDPNDDPRCGACGCIVADRSRINCATCGSTLAAVGLVLPFSKKRTASWTARQAFFKVSALRLALWTILITGLAVGGTMAIDQWVLPYVWQSTSIVRARPRSRGCQEIIISTLEEYHAHGKAQVESPSASKTTRLELKTETASYVLDVDLLAPSHAFSDASGKLVRHDRLPTKADVTALMLTAGIPIDSSATHEAGIIAGMLSNFAPHETMVISSRDRRGASATNLDTTQIVFSGGQWKPTIALLPPAMYISSGLWFLGFISIIWRQRKRRRQLAAALLAPPLVTAPQAGHSDEEGGWEITVDGQDPFQAARKAPQLPAASPRPAPRPLDRPVSLKKV